jgi:CBS domain-containing protein
MSVFVCSAVDTAGECARVMRDRNIGFLPVVDGSSRLLGVVTDRDLTLRCLAAGKPATTPVGELMTRDVVVCRPDESLHDVEERMVLLNKSRVVVVDDEERCMGVIALEDIAHAESVGRAGQVFQDITRARVEQRR